jgi:hypothetical protein
VLLLKNQIALSAEAKEFGKVPTQTPSWEKFSATNAKTAPTDLPSISLFIQNSFSSFSSSFLLL